MTTVTVDHLRERFFTDCAHERLCPTDGRLAGWLFFSCPAHLRPEVREAIENDPRLTRGQSQADALAEESAK